MKTVFSSRRRRFVRSSAVVAVAAGCCFALGGCSSTTNDPTAQAGGSAGTGGAPMTGGAGSATGGSAGTGTAGAGTGQTLVVNCTGTTYQQALSNCTLGGCHSAIYPASGMNLTPDPGLAARLKDVPAKHEQILCEDTGDFCVPSTCPPAGQALLVDSSSYTKSWILKKIAPGDPMCGSGMPGTAYKTPNDMACIQAMVQAIAALPK